VVAIKRENKMKKIILLFLSSFLACSLAFAQQISSNIKSLLSSDGKAIYGNEPNSIVVIDYAENIQRVAEYLDAIDVPPQQVLIEARVVEVKLQKEHALGVNWTAFTDKGYIPMGRFKGGTSDLGLQPGQLEQTIPYKSTYYPPTTTASVGEESPFTFAIFDDNINIVLQTLANSLDTNVLSAPRVTTVNNREAEIKIIQSYPWAEPSANTSTEGATTVTWTIHFEEIGITLKVTPTINEDGRISMELKPEISEKTGDFPVDASGVTYNVPIIDRRSADTKVIIGNGQTLIIGGLIKDRTTKGETKIPLLGDIPWLGYLFKSKKDVKDKTELLIFVSPTVITPEEYVHMAKQERYGIGRGYLEDRERQLQMQTVLEYQEKSRKDKLPAKIDALIVKQKALAEQMKRLEAKVTEEEAGLKELDDAKKTIIQKRRDLENTENK
jgi:general secretion pathway protein D